ncbi:MAG: phospho-N-acetylmuramoyl-pentapeptide-transferase [Peptostreptococcaceae bacterium]|nr:phospho-N-acetylmuramoyl-pentapeptide-transferase [Peptostreptococcaceae bacterium]
MYLPQVIMIFTIGLGCTALLTAVLIPYFKNRQFKQFVRKVGPKSHLKKDGTPTMGGIAIFIGLTMGILLDGRMDETTMLLILVTLAFATIGFIDDYYKVIRKNNLGLKAWQKFGMQTLVAIGFAFYMANMTEGGTSVWVPFADKFVDFGILYIPFIIFVVLAVTNSVNLTDGLDGLASGVTLIVALTFSLIALNIGNDYMTVAMAATAGACGGFLIHNKYPAKIFMGDTGSLGLGGAIVAAAVIMKMELLIPIVGLIYVLEAVSVILQVGYFKASGGKRIFKMAPLHHHFELSGMKEQKVVLMFWSATLICAILAYIIAV